MQEIWKNIPDFDKYEASNLGNIRNKDTLVLLSNKTCRSGYIRKSIKNNENKKIKTTVHYLICLTFNGEKPSEFHTVDHIDKNKQNNHKDNLRWSTHSEQNVNKIKKNTIGGFPIEMIDFDSGEIMATFKNASFASKILGLTNRHSILQNINNKNILIENCYFRNQLLTENFENEIWKKIHDNFWISSYGRIKNDDNKPLNITNTKHGYQVINCNHKTEYVHRLVARTFIENPNNLKIVNHIDNNGLNNNVENLEWCTQKENIQHAKLFHEIKNLKKEQNKPNIKQTRELKKINVYKFDLINKKLLQTFNTIEEAAENENIFKKSMISRINKKTRINGISWSYSNEIPEIINKHEKHIYKFDKNLALIKIYNTIEEAAKSENIASSTMRRITKNNSLINDFIYSRIENPIDIKNKQRIFSSKIIEKIDNETGKIIRVYTSNAEASDMENMNKNTLKYRIEKQIIKDGILFKYHES
jgi:hypothetical protein